MIIPGTIGELFPGVEDSHAESVLAELRELYEAHRHAYVDVGTRFENKYSGSCSCGTWATQAPVTFGGVARAFDVHLEQVYSAYTLDRCFCLRLVFASPLAPGRWVHADYMGTFYAHDPVVLERAS